MSGFLKQSTASQTRWIGPFVDDTDFKTAETGLTIANTDIKVSKNGGASANKNSGGGTHDVNGMYAVTWDATDTATVGELKYSVKVAGALQVFGSYTVLEEAIYDAMFAASANAFTGAAGSTTLTALAANSITAGVIATDAIDADAIADNAINAGAIASDAITSAKIADNAITAAKIASDAITAAKIADGAIDSATFAAGAINAAAIAADAITAAKIADGAIDAATFAAGAINAAAIAADAITDAKVASDVTIASVTGAVGSVTGNVGGNVTGSVGSVATGGITAASFAANAITAAKLDPDVTTELQSGLAMAANLSTVESVVEDISQRIPELLIGGRIDATIGAAQSNVITAAALAADAGTEIGTAVWATTTRELTAGTNIQLPANGLANVTAWTVALTGNITGNLSGSVGSVTGSVTVGTNNDKTGYRLSATGVDDIWDEAQSGHATAGTFGLYLDSRVSQVGGGSAPTVAQIVAGVWDEPTAGNTTSGTFGAAVVAAGSAGDPWSTAQPGAYAAGTFGYLVSTTIPGLLSGVSITVSSPVSQDGGTITLRRGDDYLFAIGTHIVLNFSGLPYTLVGATVTLTRGNGETWSGTVIDLNSVYFERTNAQTTAMVPNAAGETVEINCTLSGGQKVSPATALLVIQGEV